MKRMFLFAAAALLLGSAAADDKHHPKSDAAAGATAMSEGEVRGVNKEAKKITIRHGPLPNLDMPAMTMVFQVKDPAALDRLKTGDKIRFLAEKVDGAYVASRIEPAR